MLHTSDYAEANEGRMLTSQKLEWNLQHNTPLRCEFTPHS